MLKSTFYSYSDKFSTKQLELLMLQVFGHTMKATVYKTSLQCVRHTENIGVVRRRTENIGAVRLVRRRTEKISINNLIDLS